MKFVREKFKMSTFKIGAPVRVCTCRFFFQARGLKICLKVTMDVLNYPLNFHNDSYFSFRDMSKKQMRQNE